MFARLPVVFDLVPPGRDLAFANDRRLGASFARSDAT
jgi:hypothetical protein